MRVYPVCPVVNLSLNASQAMVGSKNGVTLRVTSTQTEANADPDWKASSLEEENTGKHAATETKAGLDQCVGEHNVPLFVEEVSRWCSGLEFGRHLNVSIEIMENA